MKPIILTFGVFDYFHYGHLCLFKRIKSQFPNGRLLVAVQESEYVKKFKPDAEIFYPTDVRCDLIRSLRIVDEVTTYKMVDSDIKKIPFDIFVIGEDQLHEGFRKACEYCSQNGKLVHRMARTPNISSSCIKQSLEFGRPDEIN